MSASLFLVALFSVAFATPQVGGDFRQGDVFDQDTLRRMTEVVAEKILAMSAKMDKAVGEYKKTRNDYAATLLERCSQIKVELRKTVRDTVSKAMEKNKPLDTFVGITETARQSQQRLKATEEKVQNEIDDIVQNLVDTAENSKLSLKHLNEYVQDLFINKSDELEKAGNDAAKKKILNYVKQKMAALEAILKNHDKRLTTMSRSLNDQLWRNWFATLYSLKRIESEEIAKIKKCVP